MAGYADSLNIFQHVDLSVKPLHVKAMRHKLAFGLELHAAVLHVAFVERRIQETDNFSFLAELAGLDNLIHITDAAVSARFTIVTSAGS